MEVRVELMSVPITMVAANITASTRLIAIIVHVQQDTKFIMIPMLSTIAQGVLLEETSDVFQHVAGVRCATALLLGVIKESTAHNA